MTRVFRSDFGPLAKLAAIPAAVTFAQLLAGDSPLMVFGFGLLMLLAMSLAVGAGVFAVVRRANGEFAPWGAAVRFGLRGLPRLIGWTLVAVWLITLVVMVPLLPGFGSESGPLVTGGIVLAAVLAMGVGGSIYTALVGAVLVEGQGLGRALALLRTRWLATCVRMLVLGGAYWAYTHGSEWLVARVVDAGGPGWLASLVAAVLTVPAVVFQIVVMVVTYAELRGRADGPGTGGLAAGLVGRPSSGRADAVSSLCAASGTVIVAGRRRRGFRWVTPVLVLAVLLGAGGPWWPGAGSPVVLSGAVSPVPMGLDDGAGGGDSGGSGGDSGNDAGTSISGSSDSGKDSGGNSGSDAPARAESKPDSGAGDDASRESASTVSPRSTPREDPASGDSQAREVDGSRPAEDARQDGQADTTVGRPAPGPGREGGQADSTAAVGTGQTRSTDEQGSKVGVTQPSVTDPETQNVAANPRRPGDPVQLTESASTSRTPSELPPGAVAAVPGSQPAPDTQRVVIAGQPVDISKDMLDFNTEGSTAGDIWTASGRQETLVGTCDKNSLSCTAYATDGTDRSFRWERQEMDHSARRAMDDLAFRSFIEKKGANISVAPTAAEFDQIRAENLNQRAINDRNNERVNEVLSNLPGIGGPMRGVRLGARALRELVPSRTLVGAGARKSPAAGAAGREKLAQGETRALDDCLNSFTATTPVLMADGTRKPIKDVARGNTVLATDPVTGERGPRQVTDLIRHGGPHTMVAVQLSGGAQIDATDRHPFWAASQRKWIDAIDLKPGDVVLSDRGDQIKVTNLTASKQDLTAYNLTVAGLHTYYVGNTSVLVHNANCPDGRGEGGAQLAKTDGTSPPTVDGRVAPNPLPASRSGADIKSARFAQKTYSQKFSNDGAFSGKTVDEVAAKLRSNELSPREVPINVVVRDGNTLITNTRSAHALERAGITRDKWNVIDRTGDKMYENLLSGQLRRNRLTSSGFESPRGTR